MKRIQQLQDIEFNDKLAVFFTKEGIIVERSTGIPAFKFAVTVEKLGISSVVIYLDGDLLLVRCHTDFKLSNAEYAVIPSKFVLRSASTELFQPLLRAIHWMTWDQKSQFCTVCGGKLVLINELCEKKCTQCGYSAFPNLHPAIMVLIQREKEILLARPANLAFNFYSALAGFIDLGETAEMAVHREVKEEVDLQVCNLKYFGTQSWPFPSSFMIAFTAEYLSGEICVDKNELSDAKWFSVERLPEIPPAPSISHALIRSVCA